MEDALHLLREGRLSPPDRLPSFANIQTAVGFPVGPLGCSALACRSAPAGGIEAELMRLAPCAPLTHCGLFRCLFGGQDYYAEEKNYAVSAAPPPEQPQVSSLGIHIHRSFLPRFRALLSHSYSSTRASMRRQNRNDDAQAPGAASTPPQQPSPTQPPPVAAVSTPPVAVASAATHVEAEIVTTGPGGSGSKSEAEYEPGRRGACNVESLSRHCAAHEPTSLKEED